MTRNTMMLTAALLCGGVAAATAQVNVGIEPPAAPSAPSAPSTGFVLMGTINDTVHKHECRFPFGRDGKVLIFATKDVCEQFKALPMFPQILESLFEVAADRGVGRDGVTTACEPFEDR